MLQRIILSVFFVIGCCASSYAMAKDSQYYLQQVQQKPPASLLLEDVHARKIYNINSTQGLVPASTIKILTAFMAVEYWGLDHRFHTDVVIDKNKVLWIKGYGDPYLISEEIQTMAERVAQRLRQQNITHLHGIGVDDSYFDQRASQLLTARSLNPYDAPLGALSANFNSLGFNKRGYHISPIEWQTPVTGLTVELSELVGDGKHRISLRDGIQPSRYFKEVFTYMLNQQGITIDSQVRFAQPQQQRILYRHYNSHPLSEVVQKMLKYSNNFVANQLFLALGASTSKRKQAASMQLSQEYTRYFINKRFNWRDYHIDDGAGLSRRTAISTEQMVDLLHAFKPYHFLLPCIKDEKICAKTGTLSDVHSYAGYFVNGADLYPFAIFFAQKMPYRFRRHMASALYDELFSY